MAGFGAKNKSKGNARNAASKGVAKSNSRGSSKNNARASAKGNPRNQASKNFNVDANETSTLRKTPSREVSDKELERLAERVELPKFIGGIKSCDEKFFIHMINHSKTKEFDPFLIGSIDGDICEILDQYIRESKEEFVPSDSVDLSNGKKLVTLER